MAEMREPPAPPGHVAIIMDGNGRWAAKRGRPRAFGHRQGVESLRTAVKAAGDLGVKQLTVFSFSTENWRRPADEVDALFELLRRFVAADLDRLASEGVCIKVIGRSEDLSDDLVEIIENAEARTRNNTTFKLVIAFNYGGRDEIVRAARRACRDHHGDLSKLTEDEFARYLDTTDMPDPDLVIRTSGEHRVSNFLLWQAAYAEFVFTDVLWPDFTAADLKAALDEYSRRKRRYGGVNG
jgi:undecaprenyl diphosphate synthase